VALVATYGFEEKGNENYQVINYATGAS